MRTIRLPQVQNVGPNQRASLRLPLGVVYEKLYFRMGGNIVTGVLSNIVLKLNTKEFQRWATSADMNALNGYKGNIVNANFMVMDFTERQAKEEVGMKMGAIAASQDAGVQDFTLEFDLGNYAASTANSIEVWADVDVPSANTIIQRVQYGQKTIAAAAEEQIFVPYGAQGFQLKRLIIKHANVASVRVRRDGAEVYENLPVALANVRQQDFGRVPQGGYHIVDFLPDSLQSNALNTAGTRNAQGAQLVQNLDIRVTTTAADTLTIYTESYDLNGRL
ncbi:MAG: major capsid protein P2 [Aquabacterium sp.]|uniref:major capsid protein P2 n=1 Tax=Aquabacterium sp. TaxID=1872578 RepID=UPI003BAE9362